MASYSFPIYRFTIPPYDALKASLNQGYISEIIQTDIYRQSHWLAVRGFFNRSCCIFVSPDQLIISNHRPRWTTVTCPFHQETTKTVYEQKKLQMYTNLGRLPNEVQGPLAEDFSNQRFRYLSNTHGTVGQDGLTNWLHLCITDTIATF